MPRLALALCGWIVATGCSAAPVAPQRTARDILAAVWVIRTPMARGSGTVIRCEPAGKGYRVVILTARHVLHEHDPDKPYLVLAGRRGEFLFGGKVLAVHAELDVALLVFDSLTPVAVAPISDVALEPMQPVYSAGYSGGAADLWISRGVACAPDRCTAPAAPGDSGGPVFTERGEVAGVVSQVQMHPSLGLLCHHQRLVPARAFRAWALRPR